MIPGWTYMCFLPKVSLAYKPGLVSQTCWQERRKIIMFLNMNYLEYTHEVLPNPHHLRVSIHSWTMNFRRNLADTTYKVVGKKMVKSCIRCIQLQWSCWVQHRTYFLTWYIFKIHSGTTDGKRNCLKFLALDTIWYERKVLVYLWNKILPKWVVREVLLSQIFSILKSHSLSWIQNYHNA